ncbi:MAG TPA: hypothetical protein VFJ57_00935 [Solirubrobacterales bacterium]|nr:hypothetical protein [Solirubrobacterales bacterium]
MSGDRHMLGTALVAFLAATCDLEVDLERADLTAPLFDAQQRALAGHALDSLAIAEALVALEEDLEIEILGRAEYAELGSIEAIADFVAEAATPARVTDFERRWGALPRPNARSRG